MKSDAFLFIGILIFLFVIWIAAGGPKHPISFAGPYITPITTTGGTATGYSLSRGPASSSSGSSAQTAQSLSKAQTDVVSLEKALVSANQFGDPSPYKGLVTINHARPSSTNTDPDKEYVTISVSSRATTGIDVTGWRIESEAVGHSSPIPDGVAFPHSGQVNDSEPIVLLPGDRAILTTGESPLGYSFRENMCTGYLAQFQTFTPSLAKSCPLPSSDFARFYTGNVHSLDACKAYVRTIPQCTIPEDEPSNLSQDCQHFIYQLDYNDCTAVHLSDKGFFGTEWRIFFNRDEAFFTHSHDTLKLLDSNGKTVDLLSY